VWEVAKKMQEQEVGAVLITSEGKPRGIVTDRDLVLRCLVKKLDPELTTVEEVMTPSVETIAESEGLFGAIRALQRGSVRRIVIVDEAGSPCSLLSFDDVFEVLAEELGYLKDVVKPTSTKIQTTAA
jgi:CBS domain-containing protein